MRQLILALALVLLSIGCGQHTGTGAYDAGTAPHRFGAVRVASTCPAQSVAAWFINPSTGNDLTNTCISSASPCKTYREVTARWGCGGNPVTRPAPTGSITVHFAASQPDTTDRVVFDPILNEGASAYLVGDWTQIASGTFASVTPFSTSAADGRWKADLGTAATGLVSSRGLFVVNGSRGNSVAAIHAVISGTQVALTPPMATNAPVAPARATIPPAENTAWAAGDAWQLMQAPSVYVSEYDPLVPQSDDAGVRDYGFMEHIYVPDPAGAPGRSSLVLGHAAYVTESWLDPLVVYADDVSGQFGQASNTRFLSGKLTAASIFGGSFAGSIDNGTTIDGDTVIDGDMSIGTRCLFGSVDVSNADIDVFGQLSVTNTSYAADRIYGTYTMDVSGASEVSGVPGASLAYTTTASATFLGVPTWQVDHQTIACAHDTAHQQAPPECGVTVNDTTIDAAITSGGFGGIVYGYGGSIVAPTRIPTISAPSSAWIQAGANISVSQSTGGAVVISSTASGGVTSLTCSNGVSCSPSTGAVDITGVNAVANGFTGDTTFTTGAFLTGNGISALTTAGPCAVGQPILGNGAGAQPTCGSISLEGPVANTLQIGNGGTGFTSCASGNLVTGGSSALGCALPSTIAWPISESALGILNYSDGTGAIEIVASTSIHSPNDGMTHKLVVWETFVADNSANPETGWNVTHGIGVNVTGSYTASQTFSLDSGATRTGSLTMSTTMPPNSVDSINLLANLSSGGAGQVMRGNFVAMLTE